ncbi:hypothetical protein F4819DRAFT_371306 [Hypoxylon fuscum]|nr:hypothetical protein F4819DRAFT_371306 [Hypoxylon fuscum]
MQIASIFAVFIGATTLPMVNAALTYGEARTTNDRREVIPRGQPTWDQWWKKVDTYKNCLRIQKSNGPRPTWTLVQWFDACSEICVAEMGGDAQEIADWYINKYGRRWKGLQE